MDDTIDLDYRCIELIDVSNGQIINCSIVGGGTGIYLERCRYIILFDNRVISNSGLFLISSCHNLIFFNDFLSTGYNLFTYSGSTNNHFSLLEEMVYDYGGAPYSNYLGNYWNDLNGLDENGDGISENPLIISDNPEYYMDLYPLIKATEYYILQNSTYMPSFLEIDGYDLPVLITGNEELELFAERRNWSGEGTYLSPYIIENLVIDSKTHFAMHISNTNAYIIIRNCTVFGGDRSFMLDRTEGGIYFLGVKNILVKNNSLIGNYNGISIAYSENMTVTLNNISANRNYGVYLKLGSTNNIIYGNNIYNNGNAQAYESGDSTNNNWDNGTIGNYWGDSFLNVTSNPRENGYYWRKPYEISGDGEGVDNFPLVNPIIGGFGSIDLDSASTISGFNGYFSVLGLISVLVILTKIKKKIKISKILI